MSVAHLSTLKEKDDYQILSTAEYFPKVLEDIAAAQKYIFVKVPTWRNDEAGRAFAEALLAAADRGVKIFIVNDLRGDFFEYAEGNGQAFFHDNPPLLRLFQAQCMATLYGHHPSFPPIKNGLKAQFLKRDNIKVIDDLAIHDHSKVIVVDGQIGFTGGKNLTNDAHPSYGPDEARMVDYMVRLHDETTVQTLLKACLGEGDSENIFESSEDGIRITHNHRIEKSPPGFLDFIQTAQGALTVAVPFHTKPEYIHALTDLIHHGQSVTLMTPAHPTTRRYGNKIFLRDLVESTSGFHHALTIAVHPSRVHAKVGYDDQRAWVGSENWTMAGHVAETSILAAGKQYRDQLAVHLDQEILKCRRFTGNSLAKFTTVSLGERLLAKMEDGLVALDTRVAFANAGHIAAARAECHHHLRTLLAQFP